jgi:hypothetical protein
MKSNLQETWYEVNQRHLVNAVVEIRTVLEEFAKSKDGESVSEKPLTPGKLADDPASELSVPPAIVTLCSAFGLSTFERTLLLMCAGAELDSRFATVYASAHGDARRTQPTFGLALAAFEDAHWSALSPSRPLRHWNLIEVGSGETLTTSPLRIAERVLCYLAGMHAVDDRLDAFIKPVPLPEQLAASHRVIAEKITAVWQQSAGERTLPIMILCGDDLVAKRAIAATAAALLGMQLHRASEWMVPRNITEMETLFRLWEREAVLCGGALLLECDERDTGEGLRTEELAHFMESVRGPLFVATLSPRRCSHRATVVFDVTRPAPGEQREMWHRALETVVPAVNGEVEGLVSQFNLSATAIRSAATQAINSAPQDSHDASRAALADRLWDACRVQARPRLEGLAQRIEPAASWDDLILPEKQKDILKQIAVHVRQRAKVYQTWGFSSKGSRGLGISALFAGPSGTGKTMAAEVLAHCLCLDLYRIDLSQVVNKYIGETEKNLRRVFDAAEEGGAVLLFDEADALFGKRSEVKDSHDRFANIEVSYLLQRMEAYRGLAILTTNRKNSLDQAFLRRIRFVADFPFPDFGQRAEIWSRAFPALTPTEGLQVDRLARLNAAGGHIRNIAMGAAFLAADSGQPVRMSHLLSAARSEFAKLEKPLTDSEIAGWV